MKKNVIAGLILTGIALLIAGCGMAEGYKYVFTGQTGEVPPRTIDAAKAQFDDTGLIIGQSTEADVQTVMGSPAQIQKHSGNKVYIYLKSVETSGVNVDVGTNYIAEYTINSKGRLSSKDYQARPMNNPLLQ